MMMRAYLLMLFAPTKFEAIGGGMYNPASLDSNDLHRVSRFALLGYSGLYS